LPSRLYVRFVDAGGWRAKKVYIHRMNMGEEKRKIPKTPFCLVSVEKEGEKFAKKCAYTESRKQAVQFCKFISLPLLDIKFLPFVHIFWSP